MKKNDNKFAKGAKFRYRKPGSPEFTEWVDSFREYSANQPTSIRKFMRNKQNLRDTIFIEEKYPNLLKVYGFIGRYLQKKYEVTNGIYEMAFLVHDSGAFTKKHLLNYTTSSMFQMLIYYGIIENYKMQDERVTTKVKLMRSKFFVSTKKCSDMCNEAYSLLYSITSNKAGQINSPTSVYGLGISNASFPKIMSLIDYKK